MMLEIQIKMLKFSIFNFSSCAGFGKARQFSKLTKHTLFVVALLLPFHAVHAVCPVCTVAVGACVGLAQYFGIDDTISGNWIGGLIVSMIVWTLAWLENKNIKFKGRKILLVAGYYAAIAVPLYWQGLIGHPFNKLWGADKLLLGIIFGSLFFLAAVYLNDFLKKKNGGKVYFPFQKVVVPIVVLAVLSAVFYWLTC